MKYVLASQHSQLLAHATVLSAVLPDITHLIFLKREKAAGQLKHGLASQHSQLP
jgi:hypothetical protein